VADELFLKNESLLAHL